jgi:hypothetical protein
MVDPQIQAFRYTGPLRSSFLSSLTNLTARGGSRILIFFLALFGYSLSGGLLLTAFLKSFFPHHVGAWTAAGNLVCIGFTSAPPAGAHEVLGLHYLAAALTTGAALLAATHLLIRQTLTASARLQNRPATS